MAATQAANNANGKGSEEVKAGDNVAQPPKRGGKLSLKRILDMPPEVFNEVANHLMPVDLLSLARSNKFFRMMFMSRSSLHIWQMAFKNLPGLPPCPPGLCEPQYASLLFSKTCSKCGARALRRMDPYLHVRLCNSCRDVEVIEIEVFADLAPLVPRSVSIKAPRYGCVYTLRCEIEGVAAAADDEAAFPDWSKARMAEMRERQAHGDVLEDYLDIMEDARELEIDDLKMQRKD
ncbi:hypothetical protein FRC06_010659, partial [Ceratobasidium sp. 370]